jgi:hypothetical protein
LFSGENQEFVATTTVNWYLVAEAVLGQGWVGIIVEVNRTRPSFVGFKVEDSGSTTVTIK